MIEQQQQWKVLAGKAWVSWTLILAPGLAGGLAPQFWPASPWWVFALYVATVALSAHSKALSGHMAVFGLTPSGGRSLFYHALALGAGFWVGVGEVLLAGSILGLVMQQLSPTVYVLEGLAGGE